MATSVTTSSTGAGMLEQLFWWELTDELPRFMLGFLLNMISRIDCFKMASLIDCAFSLGFWETEIVSCDWLGAVEFDWLLKEDMQEGRTVVFVPDDSGLLLPEGKRSSSEVKPRSEVTMKSSTEAAFFARFM